MKLYSGTMLLVFLLSIVLLCNTGSGSDCDALLSFKNNFDDDTGVLHVWNHTVSCCHWPGITCNRAGHVVGISLNFTGEAYLATKSDYNGFSELTEIRTLVSLNLSNIVLNTFPSHVLSLVSLEVLSLYDTRIFDSFPRISNLTNLRYLDLGMSTDVDSWTLSSIGICSLVHLEFFSANAQPDGGMLTGTIPQCMASFESLQHLDLSQNRLRGGIPVFRNMLYLDLSFNHLDALLTSFCQLTSLRSLYLQAYASSNHQRIPDCIGNSLVHLVELNLGGNEFTGPVPSSLGRLSYLETLVLDDNYFTGSLPDSLGNLTSLKTLSIVNEDKNGTHTALSGAIPTAFTRLQNLTTLSLGKLGLSGSVPASLGSLGKLQSLELYHMPGITGHIPEELGNLRNLMSLTISLTGVSGNIPARLANLSSLQLLDLSSNFLTGDIPSSISKLRSLSQLSLQSNRLSGQLPDVFRELTSLLHLDASGNQLTGSIPSSIGAQVRDSVTLSNNMFTGTFPVSLCNVAVMEASNNLLESLGTSSTPPSAGSLYLLDLSHNRLSGRLSDSAWLAEQGIAEMDLSNNKLTGSLPRWQLFWNTTGTVSMVSLNLSHNNLYSELLPYVPPVSELDIHANFFTGTLRFGRSAGYLTADMSENRFSGIEFFGTGTIGMDQFSVANNNFTSSVPADLLDADVLVVRVLDLSKNRFSGRLPDSINPVASADFSHNNFSGDLPSNVVGFITGLNFSNNAFTGSIPGSYGDLSFLNTLDLSRNQLTGRIPNQLLELPLDAFNVSYNHLSGRIPQGHALTKFGPSAFRDNDGLCGAPLDVHC